MIERRPTQDERSAATRERLLEATIGCLVELGWSGTSTTEVVRRAGVSRGAQVHHYPSKDDLVFAAVEYLLDRRIAEYRAAFESIPQNERTPGAAFDLLWSAYLGDTFAAWLELAVAARCDPELHSRFVAIEHRFQATTLDLFQQMFAEAGADPALARLGLDFAFSMLGGMALSRLTGCEPARLDAVREAFKAVTAPFFSFDPGGPK